MIHYPTVNNADLEFLLTPQCKVRNSSYEFVENLWHTIDRDFWETQSLKNGLNRRFWKKIARLWLRHLRFESLLRVYDVIKPVTSFCQVFKVEICKANTTVTWQVDIICHHLGTFMFRGFFMPEYCFLRRYSGTFSLLQILWELLRDIAQIKIVTRIEISKKFEGLNQKTFFYFTVFFILRLLFINILKNCI